MVTILNWNGYLKVTGINHERYVLTCNGRRVPLRSTGRQGEFVAAVRYRAWQPPSALHPTIGVDTPLVFDLVDTWNGLAVGGCTYYVSHPGGLSYDAFPINSYEAESRRINRFWPFNHTPGVIMPNHSSIEMPDNSDGKGVVRQFIVDKNAPRPMAPPPEEPAADFAYTLDLRWHND